MAMSKKHQTVGQRYQIGDRVYRKAAAMGSGKGTPSEPGMAPSQSRYKYQMQVGSC